MAVVQERNTEQDAVSQKKNFYEFDSDEEECRDPVEAEAAEYFSTAKTIDCLHKFPTINLFEI